MRGGPVDEAVQAAAEAHGRTPAQVLLRWNLQTGRAVITTTSRSERMRDFLGVFDFELSTEEVTAISTAGRQAPQRRAFWTQCNGRFLPDPRGEPDSAE
jgi:diketogulonate reductase-like aldo/keto reductase